MRSRTAYRRVRKKQAGGMRVKTMLAIVGGGILCFLIFEFYVYSVVRPPSSVILAHVSSSDTAFVKEQASRVNTLQQKVKIAIETSANQLHKLEAKLKKEEDDERQLKSMVERLKFKLQAGASGIASSAAAATITEADALAKTAAVMTEAVSTTKKAAPSNPFAAAIAAGAALSRKTDSAAASATETTTTSGSCEFQHDVDYQDPGETVKEGLTKEQCCHFCSKLNKAKTGSCTLAVYSADYDNPPRACWIKVSGKLPVHKSGVTACWAPGTSKSVIPKDPGPGRGYDHQGHFQNLRQAGKIDGGQVYESEQDSAYKKSLNDADATKLVDVGASTGGPVSEVEQEKRRLAVKGAMQHCWKNYRNRAWGSDNISPMSGRGSESNFHHAVTMVDSLDTLWIMGMKDEFNNAKEWMKKNLPGRFDRLSGGISVFETTIRSFGGLLAAYEFSKDKVFLDLAKNLGGHLQSVISSNGVTPYTLSGGNGGSGCHTLAESGTSQIEYRYLSHVTGDKHWAEKPDKFYDYISGQPSLDGLYPNCFGRGSGTITFGADGDSFYEYLLKVWVQGGAGRSQKAGGQDAQLWDMYNRAVDGMEKWLVHKGPAGDGGLIYLANLRWRGGTAGGSADHSMEHLTCFVPGWLALGAQYQKDPKRKARHMKLAEDIAYTCWQMYERQPTGIGPERVKSMKMDLSATDTREYILRPEAAEGWYYLYELTGNPKYREWGWKAFAAMEKHLKVNYGYASLRDVSRNSGSLMDRQESFFLAETLKYLYLLQDPNHKIKLDKYVFNTEGHPLRIFGTEEK